MMPLITETALEGVLIIEPPRFGDERGFFSEVYNAAKLSDGGIETHFVQDNHSLSEKKGTVRGLHFQSPPFAQTKLVRVARGAIFDVAVDIRVHSPTYGKWIGVELSAQNWRQLLVPKGFAHGFCTLIDNTEVLYKVDAPYSREHDHSIIWDDRQIGVEWPVAPGNAIISSKDASGMPFDQIPKYFDR